MEAISDLKTFAKILSEKGYTGSFHTQGEFAGKLKDSISNYLESCLVPMPELLITGCLISKGQTKPRIECSMWIKYFNGKFFLFKMKFERKNRFGKLLDQCVLANLSVITAPSAKTAIKMVSDVGKKRRAFKDKKNRNKKSKVGKHEKVKV